MLPETSPRSVDGPRTSGRVESIYLARAVLRCIAYRRKGKLAARRGRKTTGLFKERKPGYRKGGVPTISRSFLI